MDLATGLDDVAARREDDLLVAGTEADLPFEDDGVLVLQRMDVGRHERPDRKWMLDDREGAARRLGTDLELHPDARRKATR